MTPEQKQKQDADHILHSKATAYLKKHFVGYGYVRNKEPCETHVINKRALNNDMVMELVPRIRAEPERYKNPTAYFALRGTVTNFKEKKDDVVLDEAKSCVLEFTTPPIRVAGNHRVAANIILADETQQILDEYEATMAEETTPEADKEDVRKILMADRDEAQYWVAEIYDLGKIMQATAETMA